MYRNEIVLSRVSFGNREYIKIAFHYDKKLVEAVKQLPDRLYDPETKNWFVPFSSDNIELIIYKCSRMATIISKDLLLPELSTENEIAAHAHNKVENTKLLKRQLGDEISATLYEFAAYMRQNRYSDKTVATYISQLEVFFSYYASKDPQLINNDDIVKFNHNHILAQGFSISYQSQMINAIKLFYKQMNNKILDPEGIIRPRKEKKLPVVLSMEEVGKILNSIHNIKHKTIVSTIYSAGLRLSEGLNLRITDLDSGRMAIHVRGGKGRKDRYVPLSENLKMMLGVYIKKYKPEVYLFEGQSGGIYSQTSVKMIIKKGVERSGIRKHVTAHTFRHSFATHLLENGTDLRYIQELLGHASSKTTEIYTHVTRRSLEKIKSPFDSFQF